MTEDRYYPPLDEKPLKTISLLFENDPDYFNDRNCPYSQDVINIFRGMAKFQDFDSHANNELPSSDNLIQQINQLAAQLRSYWNDIKGGDATPADKNTYFRIASSLMEKMTDMKERVSNIKQYEVFTSAVLDILDRELNVDQRNRLMTRLKEILGTPLTEDSNKGSKEDTTQETGKNNNENIPNSSFTI